MRIGINYHWIKNLGESHFVGLSISLFLVFLVSAVLFKSWVAGFYAIIPVGGSILIVYATMVLLGINLGIGTSMFASVAIGLGVDFSIHTIDRLRSLARHSNGDWNLILQQLYPLTGRTLFLNYLAIAIGFGVLISSQVVPLNNFGTIVAISVSTSFLASMSLLPALIKLTKPKFIQSSPESVMDTPVNKRNLTLARSSSILLMIIASYFVFFNNQVKASEISADEIVDKVNNVDDGEFVSRKLTMTMTDKRGKVRNRETMTYRKYYEGEKRTILFYKKPTNVKGTSFLTFDYADLNKDDDQWLYLPALRKVRRISASDRGDYFLGTDFTFEDIMLEGKLSLTDYQYQLLAQPELTLSNGKTFTTYHMQGMPNSEEVAKELGYGKTEFWVDAETWLIVKAKYWDPKGNPLKTLEADDIRPVKGILTRHILAIQNHKTGHHTQFTFSDVDYTTPVKDNLFSQRAMKRGK